MSPGASPNGRYRIRAKIEQNGNIGQVFYWTGRRTTQLKEKILYKITCEGSGKSDMRLASSTLNNHLRLAT
jgi:hypothetical protein